MKYILAGAWRWLGGRRLAVRLLIKALLFIVVMVVTLFPDVGRFARQLGHYRCADKLIRTDFEGIDAINASIDSLLSATYTTEQEIRAVQWFVYHRIEYRHDWDLWRNADYWPTAAETWQQQAEDCDGQAILAVSILRSRGHQQARLAGNLLHVWATIDSVQILGAMVEETITFRDGRLQIRWPSIQLLTRTAAYTLHHFPGMRLLLIWVTWLTLIFHPKNSLRDYIRMLLMALLGLIALQDWGRWVLATDQIGCNLTGFIGLSAVCGALFLAIRGQTSRKSKGSTNGN